MQEMQSLSNSIAYITNLGVTCLLIFMPITKICIKALACACACISFEIGWVEVQNGGKHGPIAAKKSLQYKEMPDNLTFL